jgi:hypothetical protein
MRESQSFHEIAARPKHERRDLGSRRCREEHLEPGKFLEAAAGLSPAI